MIIVPLSEAHLDAWRALFDGACVSCFCRYWHFEGDKNAWQERLALAPEESFAEAASLVRANDPRAAGLVALDGAACVGWLKLAPRAAVPKLRRQSVYKALDLGPDDGVLAVGCLLVHPEHRARGVARALVRGAVEHARAVGAAAVEAYPRRTAEPMHPEQALMGPLGVFLEKGFVEIAGEGQYPVLRKTFA